MYDLYVSDKTSITHNAFENHFNGTGNPMAIKIAIETIHKITDSGSESIELIERVNGITEMLKSGATVFIYGENNWLATHTEKNNADTLLMKLDGNTLFLKAFQNYRDVVLSAKVEFTSLVDTLTKVLKSDRYKFDSDGQVGYFGVNSEYYILDSNNDVCELPSNWTPKQYGVMLSNPTEPKAPVQNNNLTTEEVKMTKVTNIVNANKNAAVSVAKIEAGRIAVKQAVKLVKPAVPMMARGYLETAIGELVVANLFKFAVDNFAANNTKAQLVAGAMLEGAMLGAIQSLNVEQMISEVLEKVDISKFAEIANTEE